MGTLRESHGEARAVNLRAIRARESALTGNAGPVGGPGDLDAMPASGLLRRRYDPGVHGSVTDGGGMPVAPSVCDAFCSACWYFA